MEFQRTENRSPSRSDWKPVFRGAFYKVTYPQSRESILGLA